MKKQTFSVTLDAPAAEVWKILWDDATYREWTAVFAPGSCAQTDWKEGSKVIFGDGEGNGMVSRIAKIIPNEFMSFEHLGEVHNGVEDTESEKVKAWAGAHENYTLREKDGQTELLVELDMDEQFAQYFLDTWPKALEVLQQLARRSKHGAVS